MAQHVPDALTGAIAFACEQARGLLELVPEDVRSQFQSLLFGRFERRLLVLLDEHLRCGGVTAVGANDGTFRLVLDIGSTAELCAAAHEAFQSECAETLDLIGHGKPLALTAVV